MEKYIIGIDTGGTYTDAVLIEKESGKVVATAKHPTSHYNLALGSGSALKELLQRGSVVPEAVECVALSSTLATNSVVENKGARVAVIVIGYVRHFKLPVKAVVYVKGGHTLQGAEEEPLDLDYLVELLTKLKPEVDAYGVCAAMSMHNPTHELVTEKAIGMIDPKPVFCSHRISKLNGMEERAATAGLHARLMVIMEEFVGGIQQAMADHGLTCPLLVIGGNGKPLEVERVIREAGLTVASGPACTATFGAAQGEKDCLVIDVGGTTTDIAMVADGAISMTEDGCKIGDWRTHVDAVNMHTSGIGGDSLVRLTDTGELAKGEMSIGPLRVTPLAMAEKLGLCLSESKTTGKAEEVVRPLNWLGRGDACRLIVLNPGCAEKLEEQHLEPELTSMLRERKAVTAGEIRSVTGLGGIPLEKRLEQLSRKQLISEIGFTPTDALHVLGKLNIGDSDIATHGALLLAKELGISAEELCRRVVSRTEEKIEDLIIDYVIQHYWQNTLTSFISRRKDHPVLGVAFSLKLPLVGIGAAARYFLPPIAERLKTSVVFPQYCEVGNGVGAAMIGRQAALQKELGS